MTNTTRLVVTYQYSSLLTFIAIRLTLDGNGFVRGSTR